MMVAVEHVPDDPTADGERRFRALAGLVAASTFAYLIATAAGAPSAALSVVFNVQVSVVPVIAWWAYRRSAREQRALWLLLALGATFWLLGTLVWVREWWALGQQVPTPPGAWDALFIGAYAAVFAAVLVGMRESVHLLHALLDTLMLVAATLALGAILLHGKLEYGYGVETVVIAARPALGVAILALLASAAFGSWVGITRATALVGAGQGAIMAGSIVFSIAALQGHYADDRWPNVLWGTGAGLCTLGGAVVILRVDRGVARERPPLVRSAAGATGSLALALAAIAVTLGVAYSDDDPGTTRVALAAIGVIAAAASIRALIAVRAAKDLAAEMNTHALRDQQERDRLRDRLDASEARGRAAESELVALQVVHESFQRILEMRDEETDGRLRANLGTPVWELLTLERDGEEQSDT